MIDTKTQTVHGVPNLFTQRIYEYLRDLPDGVTTVTDDQLTKVAECDCVTEPGQGRASVRAACKRVLRVDSRWWKREHGAGCIKRLNRDPGRATVSVTGRQRHSVKYTRDTVTRIKAIDKTVLTKSDALMFTIQAQQGAAMVAIGSGKTTKKMLAHVETGKTFADHPDMRKLLEAMRMPGVEKTTKADDNGDDE